MAFHNLPDVVVSKQLSAGNVLTFTGTSDTIAAGDIIQDDWKFASSGDYDILFETNYPLVNESTFSAEERFRVGTTDANGALLAELATYDANGIQKGRGVFSPTSKGPSDIIIGSLITKARNGVI